MPFLDIAYQGFGDSIEADAAAVRLFAQADLNVFVSSSFSKSFSLYGERVGALSIITTAKEEASRVLSQLKRVIRTNYSNPPTHGGSVVAAVLGSPELRATWEQELGEMRDRIRAMRNGLVERLKASGVDRDFSFVNRTARHVLVLGPDRAASRPPARGVRHLRRQHGPHLRGRAEHAQPRRRGQRDRSCAEVRLRGRRCGLSATGLLPWLCSKKRRPCSTGAVFVTAAVLSSKPPVNAYRDGYRA